MVVMPLHMYYIYILQLHIGAQVLPEGVHASSGPIFLSELECSGTESSLTDCFREHVVAVDCDHTMDVNIQCRGVFSSFALALVVITS